MNYSYFTQIRKNYGIAYYGYAPEYLVQLCLLRPIIESHFPQINIFLACRDDFFTEFLSHHDRTLKMSEEEQWKRHLLYLRSISTNLSDAYHPVHQMLDECGIKDFAVNQRSDCNNKICSICPQGVFPTHSMSDKEIKHCESNATSKGFRVYINPDQSILLESGWVIGVENSKVFTAASEGKKTSLFPLGLGTQLYKKMFPAGEVLKKISSAPI